MTIVIKQPRRARKKATVRSQIISTAIKLFSRHGLDAVTVEHIADVADIGKGTLYNYFKTKEDIVVAFMAEKEREIQARVKHLLSASGSAESILAEYIRFQFRLKRPYHSFVRVFLAQMFLRTADFLPYMAAMQKHIDPNLHALFHGLQQRGLIRKDISVAELVVVFKTVHLGLTALWAVEGAPFKGVEQVLQREVALFCHGLEAAK